ncbi:NAD(P)/FAD-dependent oxidoreductase [Streptomyces sp. AM6-12]|uniref:NAD(P)/FAD-dependent oxidoreductase n=1 Tax=Streptomyces sp. AM6-12 TaxID=3345149 RepID=UPI0037A1B023
MNARKAVVIGAGPAGLLAAAALAPTVAEVVVLDHDELPEGPEHRRGVPQSRHAHLLMPGGLAVMEELLPGADLQGRLVAAGARQTALSSDLLTLAPVGWFRRWRHRTFVTMTASRPLLEWGVRRAVLDTNPNVTVRRGRVSGLRGSARRVTGVRLAGTDGTAPEDLDADWVVDASGRGTRLLPWLDVLGVHGIPERHVDSGLANATRVYRTPPGAPDWPMTLVQADPWSGQPGRSGMIVPIEDGQWMVSLGGMRGSEPPKDPDAFVAYALDLPSPLVGRLIEAAEPLGPVHVSRSTSNSRRYLEKARLWPERLVAIGDAAATFNPIYGQGMSAAAFGARALARAVREHGVEAPGLARRVQRAVARAAQGAWTAAVSTDVLYPGVEGGRATPVDRLTAAYSRRLNRAATGSYAAAAALWDVTTLGAPPGRLFRPDALLHALTGPPLPALAGPPLTPAEREFLAGLTPWA